MTTASRIAVLFAGAALLAGPVADAQPPKLPRPGADGPPPLEPTGFKLVEKIETKENTILALDAAADGRSVAISSGWDVVIWDLKDGKVVAKWEAAKSIIDRVKFTDGGKTLLATSGSDRKVVIRDARSGEKRGTLDLSDNGPNDLNGLNGLTALDAAAGEGPIVTGSRRHLKLWDSRTGRPRWQVEGDHFHEISLSADLSVVAVVLYNGEVRTYRASDGKELLRVGRPPSRSSATRGIALSRGGEELVIGAFIQSTISILDLRKQGMHREIRWTERPFVPPPGQRAPGTVGIERFAISPDGATLAASCCDRTIRVYDTTSWELRGSAALYTNWLAFTAASRHLLIPQAEGVILRCDWRLDAALPKPK